LDAELRAWRKAHAAKLEVPPFHLLADSLLHEIVLACPVSLTELNQVPGMGPSRIQKYGDAISAICTQVRLDQSQN
jgi:ATP-dependent DNA helicase RecQ